MTTYACAELTTVVANETQQSYQLCKTWVAVPTTTPAITKQQGYEIASVLYPFFGALLGYVLLTKAIKKS